MEQTRPLPNTSYAVLGLLAFGEELSGYDLKKWADHSLRFFFWSPAISNIYSELKRLSSLAWVTSRSPEEDSARGRRVYRITDAGSAALAEWLQDTPVAPPMLKDHALLRIWLGHVAGKRHVLEILAAEEDESRRTLDEVTEILASARRNPDLTYAALVEQWCVRYAAMRLDAFTELRAALEAIDEPEAHAPGDMPTWPTPRARQA